MGCSQGGEGVTKSSVARKFGLNRTAFLPYVDDNITGRKTIGSRPGRKSVVSEDHQRFLTELTIRADGFTCNEIISHLQTLDDNITTTQAKNYVYHTLRKNSNGRLKPKLIKAQKTTNKRSQCSVAHRWRWDKNVRRVFAFLREKNTGVCKVSEKSFGEVIDHFVVGADDLLA